MTDLRKAAEMALEALFDVQQNLIAKSSEFSAYEYEIKALRQALAQPEQEPVAWLHPDKKVDVVVPSNLAWFDKPLPLYTAPPSKPWASLTDEEIKGILYCGRGGLVDIKKAEQILKEKNT